MVGVWIIAIVIGGTQAINCIAIQLPPRLATRHLQTETLSRTKVGFLLVVNHVEKRKSDST